MTDLSIIIPARNEKWLARTIQDIVEHIEGDTEVIAVIDGEWPEIGLEMHPRVTVVWLPVSIGQRAATNLGVRLSKAKYIMKVDAHCAFDQGFDVKMMADMQDNMTMVPTMRNLHVFDWACDTCGRRWYQGPTPKFCCKDKDGKVRNEECDGTTFHQEIVWNPKTNPQSLTFRFDRTLHFQYWGELKHRPGNEGDLVETLSIQGSCFMLTRAKYWELDICGEDHGSWGQQGVEVACKTWLSGGRLVATRKTWYAHMFRTRGDFTFPYHNPESEIEKTREYSRDLWMNNKWPKAIHTFEWLLEKFTPVPGWHVKKGILYYTDNGLDEAIMKKCQQHILNGAGDAQIVSVSLKPIDFGQNIVLPLERGPLTMFKQILAGLEALKSDIVFFCEHDVVYHPTHFEFVPPNDKTYFYNMNCWQVRADDGHAVYYDCKRLSGLCADRKLLIKHYKERIRRVEAEGFSRKMGFEPGTHGRAERVDDVPADAWRSEYPNLDIRHGTNLTASRWSPTEFRSQSNCRNWQESDDLPWWGKPTPDIWQ